MRSAFVCAGVAMLATLLPATRLHAADGHEGRGWRWVRSHPFTVMALVVEEHTFDAEEYRKAGMDTVLLWKPALLMYEKAAKGGLQWHGHAKPYRFNKDGDTRRFDEEMKSRLKHLYETYPGCTGWLVMDEPHFTVGMKSGAKIISWLRQRYPDTLIYTNIYPKGALHREYYGKEPPGRYSFDDDYIPDVLRIMKPDILMSAHYPFNDTGGTSRYFYLTVDDLTAAARKAGIPAWFIVQSSDIDGGIPGSRLPSESDMRMQVFTALAYGCTGIVYFVYRPGLVELDGTPGRLYYAASRLNREVVNVGQALRFLDRIAIYSVLGHHKEKGKRIENPRKPGMPRPLSKSAAREHFVKDIAVVDEGVDKDIIVAFMRDDRGGKYMMLVNQWHDADTNAADRKLTVTIRLAPRVGTVGRLSRETGRPELLRATRGVLTVTLPGGTGNLFKIGNANFPGLEPQEQAANRESN